MKLSVYTKRDISGYQDILKQYSHCISKQPDVIISLGGDGTYLECERKYPKVPKLIVRDQSICKKCEWLTLKDAFEGLISGKFEIKKFQKLEAQYNHHLLTAVNDVVVRNVNVTSALRFSVKVNGKTYKLIGDGIVACTTFGSQGYFYSVTGKHFHEGFGLAFNNVTAPLAPVISKRIDIELTINRNTAHLASDNDPKVYTMEPKDKVYIRASSDYAFIVKPK